MMIIKRKLNLINILIILKIIIIKKVITFMKDANAILRNYKAS